MCVVCALKKKADTSACAALRIKIPYHIKIDLSVKPMPKPPCGLKRPTKTSPEHLNKMEAMGVIREVDEITDW